MTEPKDANLNEEPPMTAGRFITLALKGAAMGAANVVPGVSGGTIALLTGIYEEFIGTLKSIDWEALRLLFAVKFRDAFAHVNGPFACALGVGLVVSWFTLARLLKFLLANAQSEMLTMAFFFGLIIASVFAVGRRVPYWPARYAGLFLIGAALAGGIVFIPHAGPGTSSFYIFLCGSIAMSAMILPGISGSFILLMMGTYLHIITAITEVNFAVLAPFALGCTVGLLGFSRVLSFILEKFHNATLALLTGFVTGSLAVIWPWKDKIFLKENGEYVMHKAEKIVTGYTWQVPEIGEPFYLALLLMAAGAGLVPLLDWLARDKAKPESE